MQGREPREVGRESREARREGREPREVGRESREVRREGGREGIKQNVC
jgi:hypothetical protein